MRRAFLFFIAVPLLLADCNQVEGKPQDATHIEPTTLIEQPQSSPTIVVGNSPSPVESSFDPISWDLYPGLQTKINQMIDEKNCEALIMIANQYSKRDKALESYLSRTLIDSGCP